MSNTVSIDIGEQTNTCFVVMPFASLFQLEYEKVIKPAVEATGLKCIRGDEIYAKPDIVGDIWRSLRSAQLVIAELTGRNPNVLYEVGLANALGKPIILLTREATDVPFDLKALRYLFYETDNPFWGENLVASLTKMIDSALNNPELSKHLEGIHATAHRPPKPSGPLAPVETTSPSLDISGQWSIEWTALGGIQHSGILVLQQFGSDLSGVFTVTYEKSAHMTVVQETLIGAIDGRKVHLDGASYTYVKQGPSAAYTLDSFKLTVSDEGESMTGLYRDKKDVTFTRMKSKPNA